MKVVLDTNILVADFWMNTPDFRILFEIRNEDKIELYIPKVVLDEVGNKFKQRLEQSFRGVDKEIRAFSRLSRKNISASLTEDVLLKSIGDYQLYLKKQVQDNNIQVLPYPKTDHEFLARKAMEKKKPFNSNEKGYRDSLIWEGIKSLLTAEDFQVAAPELVFVTSNWRDFANEDYSLHKDLIEELDDEAIAPESIQIFPDLTDFNDKLGKLFYKQESSFLQKIKDGLIYDFDLKPTVNTYLLEEFVGASLEYYDFDVFYPYQEPTVASIEEDYEIKVSSIRKMNSKNYIVDFGFDLMTEVHFFLDKGGGLSLPEDSDISILDANWNRHVVHASTYMKLPMKMTAIVDTDLLVTSCQIDQFNSHIYDNY